MRFIPTSVHGILDYLTAVLLITGSFWLWDHRMGIEMWLPILLGAGTILYSAFTDYEWGAFRQFSMAAHLRIDFAAGLLLAVSPWLFGFADLVWQPHLYIGIFEIGASLLTQKVPHPKNHLGPNTF